MLKSFRLLTALNQMGQRGWTLVHYNSMMEIYSPDGEPCCIITALCFFLKAKFFWPGEYKLAAREIGVHPLAATFIARANDGSWLGRPFFWFFFAPVLFAIRFAARRTLRKGIAKREAAKQLTIPKLNLRDLGEGRYEITTAEGPKSLIVHTSPREFVLRMAEDERPLAA